PPGSVGGGHGSHAPRPLKMPQGQPPYHGSVPLEQCNDGGTMPLLPASLLIRTTADTRAPSRGARSPLGRSTRPFRRTRSPLRGAVPLPHRTTPGPRLSLVDRPGRPRAGGNRGAAGAPRPPPRRK